MCNNANDTRCWLGELGQWSDVDCCEYKMVIVIPEEGRSRRVVDSGYVPVSDRFMLV
jgi:hypothetical protein